MLSFSYGERNASYALLPSLLQLFHTGLQFAVLLAQLLQLLLCTLVLVGRWSTKVLLDVSVWVYIVGTSVNESACVCVCV